MGGKPKNHVERAKKGDGALKIIKGGKVLPVWERENRRTGKSTERKGCSGKYMGESGVTKGYDKEGVKT